MKTFILLIFAIAGSVISLQAVDTNTAPKTAVRLHTIVKRGDGAGTNVSVRVVTNRVAVGTNTPRSEDRLRYIVRRGTNQPPQIPTNKP